MNTRTNETKPKPQNSYFKTNLDLFWGEADNLEQMDTESKHGGILKSFLQWRTNNNLNETSKLSLLLFEEVSTGEYIYFSYLMKEKSCFYCQLYGRVEIIIKKYPGCQKPPFFYSPYLTAGYSQALYSLFSLD